GEDHYYTMASAHNLAVLLQAQGNLPDAERYLREVVQRRQRLLGEEHTETLRSIARLGAGLKDRKLPAEAEAFLRPAAAVAQGRLLPQNRVRRELTETVARLYEEWNEADPGKGYDTKAAEWRAKLNALPAPQVVK